MSYHWSDNVHTTAFTPRDYQVELLAAAREKNIVICLAHNSSKEFIALKLLQELAHEVRNEESKKVSLYITNGSDGSSAFNLIHHLTDLVVINVNVQDKDGIEWEELFETSHVVILSAIDCLNALICGYLNLENVNVLIIEDCHKRNELKDLVEIFKDYYQTSQCKPKVLGLAGPLHNAGCPPARLTSELAQLERIFHCKAETASDIVTVLRYCAKPTENILQCAPPKCDEVIFILQNIISSRKAFIDDHRYDPSEIYSDEFLEELQAIPDPKKEPLEFLESFLSVLNEMGPWCADRAAFNLLVQIEKQKVKTPYERHFMLLCLISTTFVEIRSYCDYLFQKFDSEKQRIENFSSPKVLRLLEILKHFKPDEGKLNDNTIQSPVKQNSRLKKVSEDIEKLDFKELGDRALQTIRNVEESQGKDSVTNILENLQNILIDKSSSEQQSVVANVKTGIQNEVSTEDATSKSGSTRQRYKRKHTIGGNRNRHYNNNSTDPDALCGIVYCNDKNIAKILFSLLYESSKNDPDLNFLNVQYTVDRVADPITEAKEAELEHRKQEEVLKRFRMHECNLLIGTSVLEEGIDLPKCNLVIRWDPPQTYRSYVQCKGRARASNAFHIILVAPTLNISQTNKFAESDPWQNVLCSIDQNEFENEETEKNCSNAEVEMDTETCAEEATKTCDESIDETKENPEKLDENKIAEIKQSNQFQGCNCTTTKSWQDTNEMYKVGLEKMESSTQDIVACLAQYIEIEKMLLAKCDNTEPFEMEQANADKYTGCVEPYKPLSQLSDSASVNLGTAVALVNKYCAKLPSDTFTKLTPLWRCSQTKRKGIDLYLYTIRLPINSPLKYDIKGIPMPTKILARRVAALIACKELHECGELDDSLQPIGKEGFKASESDWEQFELEKLDEQIINENIEPRPGTTKRRQYYYKRIATAFSNCRPTVGSTAYLYHIKMTLECPIPEEQNTRGRKVYPPEDAVQGFGILILKKIPKVSAFPIFTRSGEVRVSLELSADNISLTEIQINHINTFLNYTFTNVLRLQKFLMLFDPEATENCFFVVPTVRDENAEIKVDWKFLELISKNSDKMPKPVPDEVRKGKEFDANKFRDAVVMPWYRNQDQPQYFYVAEICNHLSPQSSFPGENYSTFQEYYFRKYGLTIQNLKQPLLDVDHTSARLNFLTPRYVNRKGVALPTSSEETKRAKRENLEQKQILVPELCTIHPFPASLWRAAVCLPCILYRINALLLADEIRKQVSYDLGLGRMTVEEDDFEWPILDFGWSLAEVLKKSREAKLAKTTNENKGVNSSGRTDVELKEEQNGAFEEDESKSSDGDMKVNENLKEKTANDLLEEAHEKLKSECLMEIGTWSNDMAENIDSMDQSDEEWGLLPPNVNLCSRNNTKIRYGSPTSWDVGTKTDPIENYFSDSDVSYNSDEDYGTMSIDSNDNQSGPLRIEFKSDNVAEAIETEEEMIKRQKQLAIIENSNANEKNYQNTKNVESGFDCFLEMEDDEIVLKSAKENEDLFMGHITSFMHEIRTSDTLVRYDSQFTVSKKEIKKLNETSTGIRLLLELVPYISEEELREYFEKICPNLDENMIKFSLPDLLELNRIYTSQNSPEMFEIGGTGDIFDNFSDSHFISIKGTKKVLTNYLSIDSSLPSLNCDAVSIQVNSQSNQLQEASKLEAAEFNFDYQPDLNNHPGPSPSIILQALTMSNANDGINLERLETIGDSFLKYAITTYLYCKYENVHEGKLSHLRSKQVSNLNLYRLGRLKVLGECMIATKFEPHDNWLPPCYYVPKELEKALIEARIPACHWNLADLPNIKELTSEEICKLVKKKAETLGLLDEDDLEDYTPVNGDQLQAPEDFPCFIPYNLVTQHSIPDKSIADCVEALIGAYLIECGPRGALLFMAWLGIRVLPVTEETYCSDKQRVAGSTQPDKDNKILIYGEWSPPKSPLLSYAPNPTESLELLLNGYGAFEDAIAYRFKDRSYLLQAMTHASYSPNRLSDCYQRLEFLGDAVLDYLITRHLYEDPRQHSPGALTDLRSALVNNTIFASLAVRHGFHKYFRHLSPGLNEVIDRFVRIQHENGHSISEEYYLLSEEECDEAEDVEVPKALGDVFESVAGAIFLDSNMSLDTVWKVYSNMMRPEIEQFSNSVPKSPIRELLELEPETAKFSKPEKLADGRRVRVTVEVFGKGNFRGIGRNYRIAKCTAAKCALRQLKKRGLIMKRH